VRKIKNPEFNLDFLRKTVQKRELPYLVLDERIQPHTSLTLHESYSNPFWSLLDCSLPEPLQKIPPSRSRFFKSEFSPVISKMSKALQMQGFDKDGGKQLKYEALAKISGKQPKCKASETQDSENTGLRHCKNPEFKEITHLRDKEIN